MVAFTQLIIENALINEVTNQRRLYSAAVANEDDSEAKKIMARIYELKVQIKNIKEERTMKNLDEMTSKELKELAKELKVTNWWKLSKAAIIHEIRINTDYEEGETAPAPTEEEPKKKRKTRKPAETNSKAPVADSEAPSEESKENAKAEPKRANLKLTELTYKGETKSIREWADKLNVPWPTLYDRVNRNGWSVEDAIETPLGQRRPKH